MQEIDLCHQTSMGYCGSEYAGYALSQAFQLRCIVFVHFEHRVYHF